MEKVESKIYEFDYHGLVLWYNMDLYDGTIQNCGAGAEDYTGRFELWHEFNSKFQSQLYSVIKYHAERTYNEERAYNKEITWNEERYTNADY
jgi:hypothetical protein